MKIDSKKLSAAVGIVAQIGSVVRTVPATVLLQAQGKKLSLTCANGDERITEVIETETAEDLAVCVPQEKLRAVVSGSSGVAELKQSASNISVSFGSTKCTLPFMDADTFAPEVSAQLEEKNVNCEELAAGIKAVVFPTLRSESRTILQSVNVRSSDNLILCETSDGSNGAYFQIDAKVSLSFTVSEDFVPRLIAALERDDAKLLVSDSIIRVNHKFGSYWCKRMEGGFPNLDMLRKDPNYMPNVPIGELNAEELAAALRMAVAMSDEKTKNSMVPVLMTFSKKGLSMEGQNFNHSIAGKFADFEVNANARSLTECAGLFSGTIKVATGKLNFVHMTNGKLSSFSMALRS